MNTCTETTLVHFAPEAVFRDQLFGGTHRYTVAKPFCETCGADAFGDAQRTDRYTFLTRGPRTDLDY